MLKNIKLKSFFVFLFINLNCTNNFIKENKLEENESELKNLKKICFEFTSDIFEKIELNDFIQIVFGKNKNNIDESKVY
jgi:hypothetical protein